jgi:hypothetical protein
MINPNLIVYIYYKPGREKKNEGRASQNGIFYKKIKDT